MPRDVSYSFWDNGRIFEEFWSTVDRGSANDQSGENGRFKAEAEEEIQLQLDL